MAIRIRRNVWSLPPGDQTLHWYGRAVEVMKQGDLIKQASWRYMAAVHNISVANPGAALPRHWRQCQHQSWFFLPWHRAYLTCFEAIVADIVASLGGPGDWALPYWDYTQPLSEQSQAQHIPAPFLGQTLAGGATNPLWAPRVRTMAGKIAFSSESLSRSALNVGFFTNSNLAEGFGGPHTGFSLGGAENGAVEESPHNWVHGDIGGANGLMSRTTTAAQDPIFWLHHSNIDRLWEIWRHGNGGRPAPREAAWRDRQFSVPQSSTAEFSFTCKEMLDTSAILHGYRYDDVAPVTEPVQLEGAEVGMAGIREPDLLGVSEASVVLEGALTRAPVAVRGDLSSTGGLESAAEDRILLQLEAITGQGVPGNFRVLLFATDGSEPEVAGSFSTFGLESASDPDANHGKLGLSKVFDITALAGVLGLTSGNVSKLEIAFERLPLAPSEEPETDGLEAAETGQVPPSIQVGRINLFRK